MKSTVFHLKLNARSKVNTPAREIVPTIRGRNVSLIAAKIFKEWKIIKKIMR